MIDIDFLIDIIKIFQNQVKRDLLKRSNETEKDLIIGRALENISIQIDGILLELNGCIKELKKENG